MKRLAYSALVAFILFAGNGCDRKADVTDRHAKNTETKEPQEEAMAEAAAASGYGNDVAKPGVSNQGAQTQADTSQFAVKAASASLMEVQLGKVAQQKAMSKGVKQFAQTMVTDHSQASTELASAVQGKNITLPQAPLPQHQQHIDHLSGLSGAAFDKAYMDMMVKDHQKDVAEFQQAAQGSQEDPAIKAFAQKTLPVLKKHLDLAQKTQAEVQKTSAKTQ